MPWGSGKEHQLLVCPRCLPRGGAPHCPSAPRPTHCTRAPHAAAMCIDTRDAPTLACTCTSLRAMYIRMHTPTHADMRMFMTGFMHPYIRMHTHRCTLRGATCSISQESGYPMPSRLPSSTKSPFTHVPDTSAHAYTGMYINTMQACSLACALRVYVAAQLSWHGTCTQVRCGGVAADSLSAAPRFT